MVSKILHRVEPLNKPIMMIPKCVFILNLNSMICLFSTYIVLRSSLYICYI